MAHMLRHRVGDKVHIREEDSPKYAGNYVVTKVNPKTYVLTNKTTPVLRVPHELTRDGDRFVLPAPGTHTGATLEPSPAPVQSLHTGTVVHFPHAHTIDPDALFVVTGRTNKGYRVYPLGGATRYYTNVPSTSLEVVRTINGWVAP